MKIDFLIPGISKCGTTSLCFLLAEHPQIFIPEIKEPNYFIEQDLAANMSTYAAHFKAAQPGQLLGEGSQLYSTVEFEERVSTRLQKNNPQMKLIFSVRNPLRRIESSYREFHHSGPNYAVNAPFGLDAALQELPALLKDSHYWQRLQAFRQHFPDSQIHVVFLEDLQKNPLKVLQRCYEFLGVDSQFINLKHDAQLNSKGEKLYDSPLLRLIRTTPFTGYKLARISIPTQNRILRKLGLRRPFLKPLEWSNEIREQVINTLKPDIQQLLDYCGKPADFWPDFT